MSSRRSLIFSLLFFVLLAHSRTDLRAKCRASESNRLKENQSF